jgi:DnaD/phage-associated family protein
MKQTGETKGMYATEQEDSLNNARAMMGWDRPVQIEDDSDLKKYRIELPNLYDDSDLDPYEFRLLAHYKRVGTCTESTRTTSKKCKMGVMTVSEKRRILHKKGFIKLQAVRLEAGGYSFIVSVVDKWQENFLKYGARTPSVQARTPHGVKETTTTGKNLFSVYESNIGMLTPIIADKLQDAEKTYPLDWIVESIALAVENNKRNWRYCEAILKRWMESGKDNGRGRPQPVTASEYATL